MEEKAKNTRTYSCIPAAFINKHLPTGPSVVVIRDLRTGVVA